MTAPAPEQGSPQQDEALQIPETPGLQKLLRSAPWKTWSANSDKTVEAENLPSESIALGSDSQILFSCFSQKWINLIRSFA